MAEQLHIILVPHTHWDREWYQTFQQFRMRLVRTIDKLLDVLDHDDRFTHFMLDGQTIVLDDYLEAQQEQEERLKQYIRAGRISVGPWYLQPDEFLVSGEALIRNLQIGLQRAAEFGEPMCVGYVPDCFGHIAQLPQILQGFGIDNAVFWRGVGAEAQQSEFFWAAPDGTQVLVIHLADALGYSNARVMPLAPEEFAARVKLLLAPILGKATTNTLLFMNGSDHLEPQAGLPTTIAAANLLLAHINPEHEKLLAVLGHASPHTALKPFDGVTVRMGTLPEYIETVRQQNGIHEANAQASSLQVLSGEMRSSQYAHLLPAVLSTRMWIKQQNTATEHLLEHEMEPLAAWAEKLGAPYPTGLIKLAWKYLLQNHPHDSICGCSIDQVHRENAVRFSQSQQIAQGVIAQAMSAIVAAVNTQAPVATTHTSHTPAPIVVFNPGPGPRTEVVQATVQFPSSLRNAILIDERGEHMPYTVVHRWRQELGSMPIAHEMMAAAVALMGASAPGELIRMAEGMIATTLGQPEDTYSIVRVHIEDSPQPGVLHVEMMIAPREHVHINVHEQLAVEQQILQVLQRDDITMLEITVIDQARETIEFVATDLPAYGLKTFWMYPRGLKEEVTTAPASTLTCQPQSIENE
jgi:mannosylglycerate hydrolase